MIFLDANVFLRYLLRPVDPMNTAKHDVAAALFTAMERGEVEVTTSEAVIAEIAFVLTSRRQYNLPVQTVTALLAPILRLPALKLPRVQKLRYLRAIEIWADHPRLGFVDALTAAIVEQSDMLLATFDADFDGFSNINRWEQPHLDSDPDRPGFSGN
jgi:predicted nucleic acid-binding protein